MSNSEQYRAGFEAWVMNRVPGHKLKRRENGDYVRYVTQCAWVAWAEAKREASTEPSAAYAKQLRAAVETVCEGWTLPHDARKVLETALWADGAAGALTDDAKDAACWRYIEEHATTHGGGHGFTITCFVPVDHEDMQCGIIAAIEAKAGSGT